MPTHSYSSTAACTCCDTIYQQEAFLLPPKVIAALPQLSVPNAHESGVASARTGAAVVTLLAAAESAAAVRYGSEAGVAEELAMRKAKAQTAYDARATAAVAEGHGKRVNLPKLLKAGPPLVNTVGLRQQGYSGICYSASAISSLLLRCACARRSSITQSLYSVFQLVSFSVLQ
jgi:hypothetical protein